MKHTTLGLLCIGAATLFAGTGYAQQSLYCASDDGGRHVCRVDTRGGVRMIQQVSGSECRQGYSWGYDNNGIWVDRGCRANFQVGGAGFGMGGNQQQQIVRCNSDDGNRHTCQVDTRGGVSLSRQISGSPCTQGYSWGYDNNGIWVDRGCRAEFAVGGRGGNWGNLRRNRAGYNQGTTITCSSDDGRRRVCPADTSRGVRLSRQISGSRCEEGSTWGFDNRGIWVDRGCRAEFTLGRRR